MAEMVATAERKAEEKFQAELARREAEQQRAASESAIDAELSEFKAAVPNWEERKDVMNQVWSEVGDTSYMDTWNLAGIKLVHPQEYADVANRIRRGLTFEEAVRLTLPDADKFLDSKPVRAKVARPANRTERMAVNGPSGRGRPSNAPKVPVGVTDLANDPNWGAPY
jgi:hypothetical protein